MNDFWNNIFRYPRFFISSVSGLIFVLLTPFRNLFKIRKLRILVISFIVIFFLSLYKVLNNMLGL
jgi:hypothetical protein